MNKPKKKTREYYELLDVRDYLKFKGLDGERLVGMVADGGGNGSMHHLDICEYMEGDPDWFRDGDQEFIKEVAMVMGWENESSITFYLWW